VVIFATFGGHLFEIVVWGLALNAIIGLPGVGALASKSPITLMNCIYFSAETYSSLGFGDVTPVGHVRLLVGVESLNGLLLVAGSASFTYPSMERFWSMGKPQHKP